MGLRRNVFVGLWALAAALAAAAPARADTTLVETPGRTEAAPRSTIWPATAGRTLAQSLVSAAPKANPKVLQLAARAAECARQQGLLDELKHLAVIDYTLPSTKPRLWVFDVARGRLLYQELVAHGRNSGDYLRARQFSNVEGSKMSSIGLFQATDTYYGSKGYSLRLKGLDPGFNDRALERAIVMHGAPYVSEALVEHLGRLGRSWGCPAVSEDVARGMIDTLKGGALVFAYYPDTHWLHESPFFKCGSETSAQQVVATAAPTGQHAS